MIQSCPDADVDRGAEQAIAPEIIMNAFDFPPAFRTMHINGTTIYVRSGGTGPAVVIAGGGPARWPLTSKLDN